MAEVLLPLFPLEVVLLPEAPLPLHIFEDRYKRMIGECLEAQSQGSDRKEFGVVLAREAEMQKVGCSARILEVTRRYDDGRLDILTAGTRRFEVLYTRDEKPYLEGGVVFFDDEEALKRGAFDYLQKPYDREALLKTINRALSKLDELDVEIISASPKMADYRDAMDKYQPRANKDSWGAQAYVAGRLLEKLSAKFPANPTPADVLNGMWSLRGETMDGRLPPLTYMKGAKNNSEVNLCVVPVRIKGGKFVPTHGEVFKCAPGWKPAA